MVALLVRCLAVWSATTGTCLLVGIWAAGDLGPAASFDAVLPMVAGLALVGCCAWAWWSTTVVVAVVLRDRLRGRSPGVRTKPVGAVPLWAQRLVLAACGLALVGVSQVGPAQATPGHITVVDEQSGADPDAGALAGLRLPDRTNGPLRAEDEPAVVGRVTAGFARSTSITVRAGDSLWSIAERLLGAEASSSEVAVVVDRLYDLNRAAIGSDRDLILPGHQLRTPPDVRPTR